MTTTSTKKPICLTPEYIDTSSLLESIQNWCSSHSVSGWWITSDKLSIINSQHYEELCKNFQTKTHLKDTLIELELAYSSKQAGHERDYFSLHIKLLNEHTYHLTQCHSQLFSENRISDDMADPLSENPTHNNQYKNFIINTDFAFITQDLVLDSRAKQHLHHENCCARYCYWWKRGIDEPNEHRWQPYFQQFIEFSTPERIKGANYNE